MLGSGARRKRFWLEAENECVYLRSNIIDSVLKSKRRQCWK